RRRPSSLVDSERRDETGTGLLVAIAGVLPVSVPANRGALLYRRQDSLRVPAPGPLNLELPAVCRRCAGAPDRDGKDRPDRGALGITDAVRAGGTLAGSGGPAAGRRGASGGRRRVGAVGNDPALER